MDKLADKIIKLLQSGCEVVAHVSSEGIPYFTAECPNAHVAIWPHWNVVCGENLDHKEFHLISNPAYKYVNSPEHVLDMAVHEQLETHEHAKAHNEAPEFE